MRVLIIPEDPTLDQFVLKPIVQRVFADLDIAARVEVLFDPHLSGVDQALNAAMIAQIVEDNSMIDLFLLMVDRDCDRFLNTRRAETRVAEHPRKLLSCVAVEEVETWMLALYRGELGVPWQDVRSHCDPKERYSDPFLKRQGWFENVGRGRKHAMRALGVQWRGLLSVCPELMELKRQIEAWYRRDG